MHMWQLVRKEDTLDNTSENFAVCSDAVEIEFC